MDASRLQDLRKSISDLNREILELLNRRTELVLKVWAVKKRLGMKPHDPEREREMIAELVAVNRGPLPGESIASIFRQVFRAGRGLMKK